jgi:hypothetical protein
MDFGSMINEQSFSVPNFINFGSGVRKLISGMHIQISRHKNTQTGMPFHKPISIFFFQNRENRLKAINLWVNVSGK